MENMRSGRNQDTWKLINSVALVVLASDSLEAVIPRYTSDQWKLLCFIVYVHLPPCSTHITFLPTSSAIRISTTDTNLQCPTAQFRSSPILVLIIIHWSIDHMGNHRNPDLFGCCYVSPPYPVHRWKQKLTCSEHSPGSLREPMQTSLWPAHGMVKLGTTFGLIAAAVRSTHVKERRS